MIRLLVVLLAAVTACGDEVQDMAERLEALASKEPLAARLDTLHRAASMLQPTHPDLASHLTALASCISSRHPAARFPLPDLTAGRDAIQRLVEEVEHAGDDPAAYDALAAIIRRDQLSAGLDNPSIRARIALADLSELLDPILTALDGTEVRLSRYRSKKVLLAFWATWCIPCRTELADLEKLSKTSPDLTVLALSWEPRAIVAQFLREHPYHLPVFLDTGHKLADRLHVDKLPTTIELNDTPVASRVVR